MNIMFLIFSFNTGGIEKQIIEMSDNMVQKGHHISICIINHRYEDALLEMINKNVKVYKFERPEKSKIKIKYMIKLASIVKENNISIIHCQEPTGVVFSFIAKIRNPRTKVLETVHDIGESKLYSKLNLKIADLICDKYIAISDSVRDEVIGRGIRNDRIEVINNAINTKEFKLTESNNEYLFMANNKSENTMDLRLCIGNVARFYPEKKGQYILVKAIEILINKYPSIHCSLAGGIYRGQEENWNKLKEYIINHRLESHISLCGNVTNIPDFLSGIGIFVLPSFYEGFGISLIEAMSMGIPCVASNIDGPREIIRDSSLGILAKPGSERDFAEKIDYVICNYDSFDRNKISEYVFENYDIGQMVDKHIRLFETISGL